MNPPVAIPIRGHSPGLPYLLASLSHADVPDGIPLLLTIDSAESAAQELLSAGKRAWPHGPVSLQTADARTVSEVAASSTVDYGAVILLSDDTAVSRQFYHYAQQALTAYAADDQIASISLFALGDNHRTRQPFIPLLDRGDTFFVQAGSTGGVIYTAAQWNAFSSWQKSAAGPTDWQTFLEDSQRFSVFPRSSLTTAAPVGDPVESSWRRVPLNQFKRHFELTPLAESVAVYDSHFEILPDRLNRLTDQFNGITYSVDLYATRDLSRLTEPYVLTTRRCEHARRGFSKAMRPMEANLIAQLPGDELHLAPTTAVVPTEEAAATARRLNDAYFRRYQQTGSRHLVALRAASWTQSMLVRKSRG